MKDDVNMTESSDSVKALFMFARFCHKSWSRHLLKSIMMRQKILAFRAISITTPRH